MRLGFELFVAWRYLRERGKASNAVWISGLVIAIAGLVCQLAGARMPHELLPEGAIDWRQLLQTGGLVLQAVGHLTLVFGVFYVIQSIFTAVSSFGVFLGTMALVIVLSVMNGFEEDLRTKILGSNAHLLVTKEDGTFTEWREVRRRLEGVCAPDGTCVAATTAYLTSEVIISANSNYGSVIIKGIDPATAGNVTDVGRNLSPGASLDRLWPLGADGKPRPRPTGAGSPSGSEDQAGDRPPAAGGPTGGGADDAGVPASSDDEPIDFSGEPAGHEGADAAPVVSAADPSTPGTAPPGEDVGLAAALDDAGLGGDVGRSADASAAAAGTHAAADPTDDGEPIDFSQPSEPAVGVEGPDDGVAGGQGPGPRRKRPRVLDARVAALDGVLVGRELAKNLHLYEGQEVQIVSPLGQDTPAGQVPRVRAFRVAGSFYTGMYEYDTKSVYVTIPALQSFLSLGDEVTGIEVKISRMDETRALVQELSARLGPAYRVQDWKELNRSLFSALKLEKIAMFIALTIIILVAACSIITNLIMVVVEKGREVAVLKSMGASDWAVLRVFVIEGCYIGVLGTLVGIAYGVGTCLLMQHFGLPLDPDVYYIDRLPVEMEPPAIVAVALAGLLISAAATIYPSFHAARLRPVDGLRQ